MIHADNIKPYREEITVDWYEPQTTVLNADLPDLQFFESENTKNDEQINLSEHLEPSETSENNTECNSTTPSTRGATESRGPMENELVDPPRTESKIQPQDGDELLSDGATESQIQPQDGDELPSDGATESPQLQCMQFGRVIRKPLRYRRNIY